MSLDGVISKALLVVAPAFTQSEHLAAVRHGLYEGGFIVVREETRPISIELAQKIAANEGISTAGRLVGECYVFVLARADVSRLLNAFVASYANPAALFCCRLPGDATSAVALLFPKMLVDAVPPNAEARDYIQAELKSVVIDALTEVAKKKPDNAIEYFARYLLDHNPHSPPVTLAAQRTA